MITHKNTQKVNNFNTKYKTFAEAISSNASKENKETNKQYNNKKPQYVNKK